MVEFAHTLIFSPKENINSSSDSQKLVEVGGSY